MCHQQRFSMEELISFGSAKITDARSPIMPPVCRAAWPGRGPVSLESVLKRRLNSQNGWVSPAAIPAEALDRPGLLAPDAGQTRAGAMLARLEGMTGDTGAKDLLAAFGITLRRRCRANDGHYAGRDGPDH
jgi:hypothetical protein